MNQVDVLVRRLLAGVSRHQRVLAVIELEEPCHACRELGAVKPALSVWLDHMQVERLQVEHGIEVDDMVAPLVLQLSAAADAAGHGAELRLKTLLELVLDVRLAEGAAEVDEALRRLDCFWTETLPAAWRRLAGDDGEEDVVEVVDGA